MASINNCHGATFNASNFGVVNTWNQQINMSAPLVPLDTLLEPVPDASWERDRKASPPDSRCIPGTREELIKTLVDQVNNLSSEERIIWLYGFMGCGKSAVAQTLSEVFADQGRLAGSFVFFRQAGDRSRIGRLAATLASQIAVAIPATEPSIRDAVTKRPNIVRSTTSLEVQFQRLIFQPLRAAFPKPFDTFPALPPYLIVVDGLDECGDPEGVGTVISLVLDFFRDHSHIPLRLLIASRVEEHIQTHLEDNLVKLQDIAAFDPQEDIRNFLSSEFARLARHDRVVRSYMQSTRSTWPPLGNLDELVRRANRSFIFASTLFRYIQGSSVSDHEQIPMQRLNCALTLDPGLDGLYRETFSRSQHLLHYADILTTLSIAPIPLTISAIAALLAIQNYEVVHVLVNFQALIQVPGDESEGFILFFHASVGEFLRNATRSSQVFVRSPSYDLRVLDQCLALLANWDASHPEYRLSPTPNRVLHFYFSHVLMWAREETAQRGLTNYSEAMDYAYRVLERWYPEWCSTVQPLWELVAGRIFAKQNETPDPQLIEKLLSCLFKDGIPPAHLTKFSQIMQALMSVQQHDYVGIEQFFERPKTPAELDAEERCGRDLVTKLPWLLFHGEESFVLYSFVHWPWYMAQFGWHTSLESWRTQPIPVPKDRVISTVVLRTRPAALASVKVDLERCYVLSGHSLCSDMRNTTLRPFTPLSLLEGLLTIVQCLEESPLEHSIVSFETSEGGRHTLDVYIAPPPPAWEW